MAGLQRSAVSFRRQGSSGLIWDDRYVSGELNQIDQKQEHDDQKTGIKLENDTRPSSRSATTPNITIERSRSNGGQRGYRTGRVSPAIEPPSPKVSACGFCGAFGKAAKNHRGKKPVWVDLDNIRNPRWTIPVEMRCGYLWYGCMFIYFLGL